MSLIVLPCILFGTLSWWLLSWLARQRANGSAYRWLYFFLAVPLGCVVLAAVVGVGYILFGAASALPKATFTLFLAAAPLLLLIRLMDPAFNLDRFSAYFPCNGRWLRYLVTGLCVIAVPVLVGLA